MTDEEKVKNLLTELIDMIDNGSQRDLDRADEIAKYILKVIENQKSVIEELEKIKAEIQEQIDFFKKIESFANAYGLEIANGIIKCCIAKFKGE